MATQRFGTVCDICGAGSLDYAHDANECRNCERDLCDACAVATGHVLIRDEDEGKCKVWGEN